MTFEFILARNVCVRLMTILLACKRRFEARILLVISRPPIVAEHLVARVGGAKLRPLRRTHEFAEIEALGRRGQQGVGHVVCNPSFRVKKKANQKSSVFRLLISKQLFSTAQLGPSVYARLIDYKRKFELAGERLQLLGRHDVGERRAVGDATGD